MMSSDVRIRLAGPDDCVRMAAFISGEEGKNVDPEYLRWWYYGQGEEMSAVILAENQKGEICAMATTRNFYVMRSGTAVLAAMPQKVLTASHLRGKGLFSSAYYAGEEWNLKRKVQLFLTFTNAASTPVFLGKFGYSRETSPVTGVICTLPYFRRRSRCTEMDKSRAQDHIRERIREDAIRKDREYFEWRYLRSPEQGIIFLVEEKSQALIFIKVRKFKGLKVAFLLDHCVALSDLDVRNIAGWLAGKGIAFLFYFPDETSPKLFFEFRKKHRFNFLSKYPSPGFQVKESSIFHWTMGDLDFI